MKIKSFISPLAFFLSAIALYLLTMTLSTFLLPRYILYGLLTEPVLVLLNFFVVAVPYAFLWALLGRLRPAFLFSAIGTSTFALTAALKFFYRHEPLTHNDFSLIRPALQIIPHYLKAVPFWAYPAALTLLVLIVLSARLIPNKPLSRKARGFFLLIIVLLTILAFSFPYQSNDIFMSHRSDKRFNLYLEPDAYLGHGAPYTFVYKLKFFKVEHYNKKLVKKALAPYQSGDIPQKERINIVIYQLESFKDFSRLPTKVDWTADPYADWHAIEKESATGQLIAQVYGGGTVHTESGVSTGTVNRPEFNTNRDSVPRYLKSQGYHCEAMHPNAGTFYNRDHMYPRLGFDYFYHSGNLFHNLGQPFMRDETLLTYVDERLQKNTHGPYFLHVIGIQGHGPYNRKKLLGDTYFKKPKNSSTTEYRYLNNYLFSLTDSAKAVRAFLKRHRHDSTPLVFIAYGDHSPNLSNEAYKLLGLDTSVSGEAELRLHYETPLIFWANDAAKSIFAKEKPFAGDWGAMDPGFVMPMLFKKLNWTTSPRLSYMTDFCDTGTVMRNGLVFQKGHFVKPNRATQKAIEELKHIEIHNKKTVPTDS